MKNKKENTVALDPIRPEDKVPLKEKLAYGIGGLMDGGGVSMMNCVMFAYMVFNGVGAGLASTIMMVAKIWDAITDPFMGFISDNTRGRFGRRKPYMFWGGISLLLCIFLVFLPVREWGVSTGGFTAYIIIMYLLWNTCSTVTQVPYCSMASDITPSFRERNNANTVKLVFTAAASGIGYALPLLFIEALKTDKEKWLFMPKIDSVQFWLLMSIIFGVLFGGGLIICGIFVKERINPKTPKQKFNFKQFCNSYAQPYKNRSYRWHIAMYVSAFSCMDIISALAVMYATDVWRGTQLFGMDMSSLFIIAPMMVAAVVMFPLARVIMDKKSKQFAFRMGLPFYIGGGIMLAIMDPTWAKPWLVPLVALIMGLGFGGAQMMPWIIFPDTVDVGEMATGSRQTGTYSGMMTLARKVGGGLAIGLSGWILEWCGYDSELPKGEVQPQSALTATRLVLGISVAVLITFALIASFKYKVNSQKLTRIRYFIEARKSGKKLTNEETSERAALVNELYGKVDPRDVVEVITAQPVEEETENVLIEGNADSVAETLAYAETNEEQQSQENQVNQDQNDDLSVDCDEKE